MKLPDKRERRHYFVMDADMIPDFATGAACDKCRNDHVGIEDEFHDTRSNTSSSVKMPCSAA
jgi:hypothetical protein